MTAGVLLISFQVLGSVKTTQTKEYKKLKQQLNQGNSLERRKVSFDSDDDDSSDTLSPR
jgi:hypothetical protein